MPVVRLLQPCLASVRTASLALAAAFFLAAVAAPPQAQAQTLRMFPGNALRGNMTFISSTQVILDGREERLGPGVRIRNQQNRLVFASSLVGRNFPVNYVRDATGHVSQVWLVTPTEMTHDLRKSAPNRLQGSDVQPYLN